MNIIDYIKARVRGRPIISKLERLGFRHGTNFRIKDGVIIDPGHCFLISVGNNVGLAPNVHILAHDASTKPLLGYTKVAPVTIGNNVFVGAGSIILPGVTIGDDVIIGAGSVVSRSLASNGVYVGNPARRLMSRDEYVQKELLDFATSPVFDASYKIDRGTPAKFAEMLDRLDGRKGYLD